MLRPKPQANLRNAREYFREHLAVGDYYSAGERIAGEWFGRGASRLGLSGAVEEQAFLALCEGRRPDTRDILTQRLNTVRHEPEGTKANRCIFHDFVISPPKSVSVVALYQDARIIDAHLRAVRAMLTELEKFAETRVRKSGQNGERISGEIVAATFRHDTSRELDPHLHTHCVVFNATFDPVEKRWKALYTPGMYRAQKFAENLYLHELGKSLRSLGYELEANPRNFEIRGVPKSVMERFSKRHREIDAEAAKQVAAGVKGNVAKLRERIAQDKRKRKLKYSTADRLRGRWTAEMTSPELAALKKISVSHAEQKMQRADVTAHMAWADEHLFERRSVVHDYELMAAALARGRGEDFDLPALKAALDQRGYVREEGTRRLTSREVLGCELEIVVAAHDGRNRHAELAGNYRPNETLSAEQKAAVVKILGSRDFITLFRGGAGTGKSFTLKEVERGLSAAGRPVVVLAPQRQQVRDLQADGLPAETVSRFLMTKQMPRGGVVMVDEAGQIGGKQLHELVSVTQAGGGRLILSGDTRQHGAVPASDALRAIEKHAGLKPVVISQIRRQDPALGKTAKERGFIRQYRAAVRVAAKGDSLGSFDRLDRLGCIRECDQKLQRDLLAAEYLAATSRKEKTLVVAQTREEVRAVNESIRQRLQTTGQLGPEKPITAFHPVDMGEAQKRDARFYQTGHRAFFLRRYGRYTKGDLCEIIGANQRGVVLLKDGRRSTLSYRYTDRITVALPVEMPLAAGDRLQLKFNGKSAEGAPLANGELVTVRRICKDGRLTVESDDEVRKTLAPSQRMFTRGYAVTSYGAQGKTVDTVLLSDAGYSAATNANQWYVTISRGRKRVVLFTADKDDLRAGVRQAGGRDLALDVKITAASMQALPVRSREILAAIERQRHHQAVMTHVSQRSQRIAV